LIACGQSLRGSRDALTLAHLCFRRSSCLPDKIQLSSSTASLLIAEGKESWLERREDSVNVKGKGMFETYWLLNGTKTSSSPPSEISASDETIGDSLEVAISNQNNKKHPRLVTWVVDLLLVQIRKIAAKNAAMGVQRDPHALLIYKPPQGNTSLDEVAETIRLPKFDAGAFSVLKTGSSEISPIVVDQLREVVETIASTYKDNYFHNFEHGTCRSHGVKRCMRSPAHTRHTSSLQHAMLPCASTST
jgi:hypothetical protein